ncbi:HEAT repeat-containing protein [Haladaptatus litoreus]|uniref:HEAT repeat-containing protein n=1 Tax=Haladaptatus litoreus TaxID=553468 RepID=A0A1N6Y7D4_9EURY|nr:HEAT repeat domain-containing protein [Haladaptatus litoreus]SIR10490.1 HEAT repeat-containing protein [Haladaptatus litoreus]
MSDEDTEETQEEAETEESEVETVDAETIEEQLDQAEEELESAETEADLDVVEAQLDKIEGLLESADIPEPDDEDEDDPREELEGRLSDLRDELEDQRGPYAEDVISDIEDAASTIQDTRWTDDGSAELVDVVESFAERVQDILDTDFTVTLSRNADDLAEVLENAAVAVGDADLDPDEDADTIEALVEATEELQDGIEEAEEWSDLETREQLEAEGFYDVLDHRKDYPPEWHALKVWEKKNRADMVLLALDSLQSNFMERHCLESLERMGSEEAIEPMLERANRRDKDAISILGKTGSDEAVDGIIGYVDADPGMAKTVIKALGEIGSDETTQDVANQLAADDEDVRSYAARALGRIGDTRAIDPLADTLENDESDSVRASAAWALNQIGTKRALDAVRDYSDDRSFLVQSEAEKAL